MKWSVDAHYVPLVDGGGEFDCVLPDFCLLDLSFPETGVEAPSCNGGFICFSLQFCHPLPHVTDALLLGAYMLRIVTSS